MAIGDCSVVFKLQDVNNMRLYAVKCFTQEQPRRAEHFQKIAERMERSSFPYLLRFRYLERELFVDTTQSDEEYFPVLLMDWTEGITLDTYLKNHLHDCYALQLLSFRFCRMSAWLLSQPFADCSSVKSKHICQDCIEGLYPCLSPQKCVSLWGN